MTLIDNKAIHEACYWLSKQRDVLVSNPLTGSNNRAEIAIVGAGFTGLWTAHFLKQLDKSLDVAVVEQESAGYGASGRNAGIVGNCLDFTPQLSISHFGLREARHLAAIGLRNIDELEAYAKGCDFERTGHLHVALTNNHLAACKETASVATELGLGKYTLLSKEETQSEVHSPLYVGSVYVPNDGIIDPIKLVEKLKVESLAAGVRFFEESRVTAIDGNRLETKRGSLAFSKMVLATDAYSHHLFPRLLRYFIPVYEYVLVSEPLTASQMSSIGWKRRQAVTDGRTFFNYYRLTADDRILWGGTSEAVYYPPNRVEPDCDRSEFHCRYMQQSFVRHFPQLAQLRFPYAWGGPIASTSRLTPIFGSLYKGKIAYGIGYSGHGIGTSRLAGKLLAHMVLSRPTELAHLRMVRVKPFPCPPDPLRATAVKHLTRSLQKLDANGSPDMLLRALSLLGMDFTH